MVGTINLQDQINQLQPKGYLKLRPGEYEGPAILNHSAIIEGNNTTIWSRTGPVVRVNCRGVVLKNLQVEATQGQTKEICQAAIMTDPKYGTLIENVEVKGKVVGFGEESDDWDYPLSLNFGKLPHGQTLHFKMRLRLPVRCKLISKIAGIKFEPEDIGPGLSETTIKIEPLLENSIICGSFLMVSKFIRRIAVSSTVNGIQGRDIRNGQIIWPPKGTANENFIASQPNKLSTEMLQEVQQNTHPKQLKKGHRIDLVAENSPTKITFELGWKSRISDHIEVDVVAFLLGEREKVLKDEDFIFYGNRRTMDESLELLGPNSAEGINERIIIDFSKIHPEQQKIIVALAVYQGKERRQGFAQMSRVFIKAKDAAVGKELFCFEMNDQTMLETTLIAAEIYRYKGKWKFAAVGSGYREDLAYLCRKYGLEVKD
ncbi:TerD family protein [Desulfotomaculum sp. 1211_IL3151]|uniref:TerD family protein n=1 Tax=Desulfotomaculum sp. 1211_IL3151 TaxID=3084055 RepID=UPI002FD9695C